jgi:predicted metal-dependent phosphotriesterase family hydrolase
MVRWASVHTASSYRKAPTGYRCVMIVRVLGPIDLARLGFTLPHEHVMVDFGGATSDVTYSVKIKATAAEQLALSTLAPGGCSSN